VKATNVVAQNTASTSHLRRTIHYGAVQWPGKREKVAYRRSAILLTAHFDPGPKATDYALDGDVTRLFRTPSARRRTART